MLPETVAALGQALQLLSPSHPQSLAGWRDTLTPEALAAVLEVTPHEAQECLYGRRSWRVAERARLIEALHPPRTETAAV